MTLEYKFNADSVEELIGQVIGAASSTRMWSNLSPDYPGGYGVFLDQNAKALVVSFMAEYRRIVATAPQQLQVRRLGNEPVQVVTRDGQLVSYGQVAYQGYYNHSGGRSLISGDQLPTWEGQDQRIREAWESAAAAVITADRARNAGPRGF